MSLLKKFLKTCDNVDDHLQTIAFLASLDSQAQRYPKVFEAISGELKMQRGGLKMIASENFCSLDVQLAMGNLLTDKYAEGSSHHRFYAGCENFDLIEDAAVDSLKSLFGASHGYVQPHSGSDANLIALWGILIKHIEIPFIQKLGKKNVFDLTPEEYEIVRLLFSKQKILGLALDCGGHLTHGSRVNISSKMLQSVSFGVDHKTGLIDYANVEKIAMREKPLIMMIGYSAYPRLIDFSIMREIADKCGAVLMGDMAHFAGLVAGGVITDKYNPVKYCHVVSSTTHKTLRGPRGGIILCQDEYKEFIDKGCPHAHGGPLGHVIAAKYIAFEEAHQPSFKTYAQNVVKNAQALAKHLMDDGSTLYTDGTDNHLVVIDVAKSFGLTGRQAETSLVNAGITLNRNTIPNDPNGTWYCSGIRLGTPAMTTRGMGPEEMKFISKAITDLLKATKPDINPKTLKPSLAKIMVDEKVLKGVKEGIKELLKGHPLYPELGETAELVSS